MKHAGIKYIQHRSEERHIKGVEGRGKKNSKLSSCLLPNKDCCKLHNAQSCQRKQIRKVDT